MSRSNSSRANPRLGQDPEAMLRKMLANDNGVGDAPLAKHKRYAKRRIRRDKSEGYDSFSDYPDEATRSHLLPPRERIEAIPEIDLQAERARRASQAPPPMPPSPKPARIINKKR